MALAQFAVRRPRLVIGLHLGLAAAAAVGLARLRQTDDLLIFLPPGNPDVAAFRSVSDTFGALQLAVVGIEAPAGDDIFSPELIHRLDEATRALKNVRGVDRVVSLTNLPDFAPSQEMVQINPLVDVAALSAGIRSRAAHLLPERGEQRRDIDGLGAGISCSRAVFRDLGGHRGILSGRYDAPSCASG